MDSNLHSLAYMRKLLLQLFLGKPSYVVQKTVGPSSIDRTLRAYGLSDSYSCDSSLNTLGWLSMWKRCIHRRQEVSDGRQSPNRMGVSGPDDLEILYLEANLANLSLTLCAFPLLPLFQSFKWFLQGPSVYTLFLLPRNSLSPVTTPSFKRGFANVIKSEILR